MHNAQSRSHSDPLFYESKILKLQDLFHFQTGQFMYKLNAKELPHAFIEMFTKNSSIHNYPTRQSNRFHLPLTRTLLAHKTVSFYGPQYWNSLSRDIISSPSLNCFKSKLKKTFPSNICSQFNLSEQDPSLFLSLSLSLSPFFFFVPFLCLTP